jgi:iron complex transport system substrate-binding protein
VGVSEYTLAEYARQNTEGVAANQVAQLPTVGNAYAVNWRALAALKPTLVLVWGSGTPATVKAKLRALQIPMFESEPLTLLAIVRETEKLAALLGQTVPSASLKQLQNQWAQLQNIQNMPSMLTTQAAVSASTQPHWLGVFHPIWPRPLMTINGQHVITDALRYCGARNVFELAKGLTPTVTVQQVLRQQVQVIVLAQSSSEQSIHAQWQAMLAAFPQRNRPAVVTVNGDFFHQPGPGLIAETIKLCQALQPIKQKLAQQ